MCYAYGLDLNGIELPKQISVAPMTNWRSFLKSGFRICIASLCVVYVSNHLAHLLVFFFFLSSIITFDYRSPEITLILTSFNCYPPSSLFLFYFRCHQTLSKRPSCMFIETISHCRIQLTHVGIVDLRTIYRQILNN
jgi:hypothetical protein